MSQFSYKPGWFFSCRPSGEDSQVELRVEAEVACVETPGAKLSLYSISECEVGGWRSEDVARELVRLVSKIEHHEMIEHLRFNGKRLSNPHPQKRPDEPLAFGFPIA